MYFLAVLIPSQKSNSISGAARNIRDMSIGISIYEDKETK